MRKGLLLVWLLLPVLVGFYHAGPGQERALLDEVDRIIRQAERQIAQEQWATAEESYSAALELLPNEQLATQRRLRLERAKAQLRIEKLPDAYAELTSLLVNSSKTSRPIHSCSVRPGRRSPTRSITLPG